MKNWYKNEEEAEKDCPKDCTVVPYNWAGYPNPDKYKIIKKKGIYYLSLIPQNWAKKKYNCWNMCFIAFDGSIEAVRLTRFKHFKQKKSEIKSPLLLEWLKGYTLWSELNGKINENKERARISHAVCDIGGEEGHRIRQELRHNYNGGLQFL